MLTHMRTLSHYNRWAGERILETCATLSEDEYRKARPSSYGSIHGTLNHILLADQLWLDRLEGRRDPAVHDPAAILWDTLDSLRAARHETNRRIAHQINDLTESRLEYEVVYRAQSGETESAKVSWILCHMVHHADHHRGQIHDMLAQTSIAPPVLGLMTFLQEGA